MDILRILQTSSRSVISLSGANRDAGPCYHHLMRHMLCITRNRRDSTVQLSSSISFRAVSLLRPGGFSPLQAHDNIPYFFPPFHLCFRATAAPILFLTLQAPCFSLELHLSSFPSKAFKHYLLYRTLRWNIICPPCISFPQLLWKRYPLLKLVPSNSLLSLE